MHATDVRFSVERRYFKFQDEIQFSSRTNIITEHSNVAIHTAFVGAI